jgi:signal transduction histidine kinase
VTTSRRRWSAGGAVAGFVGAGLAAVVVVMLAVLVIARRDATAAAVREARDMTVSDGVSRITPALQDQIAAGDPEAVAQLDIAVRERVLSDRIVRVKLWAPDGTVVYSDRRELIGQRFPLDRGEQEVLAVAEPRAELSNLDKPENVYERSFGQLLEVYDGVRTPSGKPLLFEAYLTYASVSADSHRLFVSMVPALLAGLLLLFAVQVPLAWSLARRVERSRRDEERLLRQAVEAAQVERRHIAADLHDGVVQSLVGASLTLTAAADEANRSGVPHVADVVGGAAADLRQGVRDLRSLIVAIVPPKLHDEGLATALADLVSPLESRGVATTLRVDLDGPVPESIETLVYRAAQEAIRNVNRHASATSVDVSVGGGIGCVRLDVRDDGVGFDPSELGDRQAAGHVGLGLLARLAEDAGGRVLVDSSPGSGTRVRLEVPA